MELEIKTKILRNLSEKLGATFPILSYFMVKSERGRSSSHDVLGGD